MENWKKFILLLIGMLGACLVLLLLNSKLIFQIGCIGIGSASILVFINLFVKTKSWQYKKGKYGNES